MGVEMSGLGEGRGAAGSRVCNGLVDGEDGEKGSCDWKKVRTSCPKLGRMVKV